jgi:hypothetical protein
VEGSILNDCSDAIVSAIHEHGGDVLKLIGDGTLAIFTAEDRTHACGAALSAAIAAHERRMDRLPISSWRHATTVAWSNSAPNSSCCVLPMSLAATLLYEVNNRGNIAIFRQLNEAPSNNESPTSNSTIGLRSTLPRAAIISQGSLRATGTGMH